MVNCSENYKAGKGTVNCPLCDQHTDYQKINFCRPVIVKKHKSKRKHRKFTKERYDSETVESIIKIYQPGNSEIEKINNTNVK